MASRENCPVCPPHLRRYWVRFYTGYYEDEGCREPPWPHWITGYTIDRRHPYAPAYDPAGDDIVRSFRCTEDEDIYDYLEDTYGRSDCTVVNIVDARNYQDMLRLIGTYFPDYFDMTCDEVARDYLPGSRFP